MGIVAVEPAYLWGPWMSREPNREPVPMGNEMGARIQGGSRGGPGTTATGRATTRRVILKINRFRP